MRPYSNSQKKKIRGWKRRIRQIDQWGERIKIPYLKYFIKENGSHTYDRCIIYPFYTLDKRHPPLWFYKLIISKFITAYFEWEKAFSKLGLPYDLQLWLYDPAYIRSLITCYKMNEEGERKQFVWESTIEKPFPHHKLASPLYNLGQFEWILADDANVVFEDDLDIEETTVEELTADGFERKVQGENEVYYTQRVGDIWIGRLKDTMASNNKKVIQSYFAPPRYLSGEVVSAIMESK